MISLIITTVCDAAKDRVKPPAYCPAYAERGYALKNWLLPYYDARPDLDEILVIGAVLPMRGFSKVQFAALAPEYGHIGDVLAQRQLGLGMAKGDVLIYQADDHWLDTRGMLLGADAFLNGEADIWVPQRRTRLRGLDESLNDGRTERYIPFHCAIYKRSILKRCPWTVVDPMPPIAVDIRHSNLLAEAGAKVAWVENLIAWDIEAGATPWH